MQAMTDTDETYQGWKNYPTWCVNLWLSNNEGIYEQTRELVNTALENLKVREPFTPDEAACYEVAETIRNFVRDDLAPDLGASFAADLLGYALDQVDWNEIAVSLLDDEAR